MTRKRLTPEEREQKKRDRWQKILNGNRRPGVPHGSKEQWQRLFNLRMNIACDLIDIYSDPVLEYFGLKKGYTKEELKKAWKRKMFVLHPDRGGNHTEALECQELYAELARRF